MELKVRNLKGESDLITSSHWNSVISEFDGHCLRLAVNTGVFDWHFHDSDELFLVLEGSLIVEFKDNKSIRLNVMDTLTVPAGLVHRTIANGRTVNLCVEKTQVDTIYKATEFQIRNKIKTQRVYSGAPWEQKVGYCRAVKKGSHISVSGTAPVDERGETFEPGNPYAQTKKCLETIEKALRELGADLSCVIRTRMYVTDISRWDEIGRAHSEAFHSFPPATSMVEVKSLISPGMMIEIEVDAILDK